MGGLSRIRRPGQAVTSGAAGLLGDLVGRGPVLAVVAHPDDESFGLGAVIAELIARGGDVRVLCLTQGEASTLGATADLAAVRLWELTGAADRLGVSEVVLHDFSDGGLGAVATTVVDEVVEGNVRDAVTLLAFESGGVTGHPDHRAASASALRVADRHRLAVLEWGIAPDVAARLNAEFATAFVALDGDGTLDVEVDRAVQLAAIACHRSQADDNPILARRLELQGSVDRIRLRPPSRGAAQRPTGSRGAGNGSGV